MIKKLAESQFSPTHVSTTRREVISSLKICTGNYVIGMKMKYAQNFMQIWWGIDVRLSPVITTLPLQSCAPGLASYTFTLPLQSCAYSQHRPNISHLYHRHTMSLWHIGQNHATPHDKLTVSSFSHHKFCGLQPVVCVCVLWSYCKLPSNSVNVTTGHGLWSAVDHIHSSTGLPTGRLWVQ